ncbi:MAG TPA: LLM class F420-dependent oxidoreductase [Candidatus Nanopelagicaceae bacterium]|nr:LLM class F420-dependent oxidoreductase [Candidatus Nanopelagicaceae bacterium]
MPSFTHPGVAPEGLFDATADLAVAAERVGFDMVTVMDHLYQIRGVGPETEPMLESYTTLGALSQRTTTVLLGALVTGVTYRNPALLVKQVTTLDVLSKGRALLGIGAAWNEDEHRGYGFDFPSVGRRMDRLDEALHIARLMFSEDRPSFAGAHYRIERALNVPRPLQAGGPKILIGGGGEQRTLRLVARYADMSNWFGTAADMVHKGAILERYCAEEGRDPAAILRTAMAPGLLVASAGDAEILRRRIPADRLALLGDPLTPEQAAEKLGPYLEAGIGGFTFSNSNLFNADLIAAAGELKRLLS